VQSSRAKLQLGMKSNNQFNAFAECLSLPAICVILRQKQLRAFSVIIETAVWLSGCR